MCIRDRGGKAQSLARWLSASADAKDAKEWMDQTPLPRFLASLFLPLAALSSPRGKFLLSTAAHVALAAALCVLPPPADAPWGATAAMFVWAASGLFNEVQELSSDLGFWAADRLNLLELPGLALATGGLLYAL
eukprot:5895271-Prymnesium_polylepis.1